MSALEGVAAYIAAGLVFVVLTNATSRGLGPPDDLRNFVTWPVVVAGLVGLWVRHVVRGRQ